MFIDPSGKPLAHLDRLAAWKRGDKPAPVTLEWDLSNRCVLGCQDCHFAYTHSRGPWTSRDRSLPTNPEDVGDLMPLTLAQRIICEAHSAGVKAIVWTGGGEPTTHPDWRQIVHNAREWGFQQGMYTLGGLLDVKGAGVLRENCSWVVVSLDAVDADTYAREKGVPPARFTAACDGIQRLASHYQVGGATIGVSFLIHEGNWQQLSAMREFALSLGAHYVTFRPTIRTDPAQPGVIVDTDRFRWIRDALPLLRAMALHTDVECSPERFAQYMNWTEHPYAVCHGIKLNATITPNGKMWVCPNRRGMPDSCVGDLSVESFAAVWARHPGVVTNFDHCRAMCRLHPVNETLALVYAERQHEDFI